MTMSERDLRFFWHHQHLDSTRLTTTDGRRVVVFSPGFENEDGGPDFHEARVRIGNTTFVGDVEVHLRTGHWRAHRHHTDPHYNSVILHVVFAHDGAVTRTAGGRRIPVVPIGHSLSGTSPVLPSPVISRRVPAATIRFVARSLAIERLTAKARLAGERLREIAREEWSGDLTAGEPWDQLLYEGLIEAMGFAKNRAPFLFLARSMRLWMLQRFGLSDRETLTALLFGAAGLLPSPRSVTDAESRAYVRTLRRRWDHVRPHLRVPLVHPADWLFFRLRPANFPPARLAAVADLLPVLFTHGELRQILSRAADAGIPAADWWREVRSLFAVSPDPFWSRHVHFAAPVRRRRACIGDERLLDISANLLVPSALLLQGLSGGDALPRCVALLEHLPAASRDVLIRSLARFSAEPLRPANLFEHQGMIELSIRM